MTTTFQSSPKLLWTSESVTEGHPDKVCDQLSDAVLDWCLSQTPLARVACESSVKSDENTDWVWIYGEVTPLPPEDVVRDIVRKVLTDIGYTDRAYAVDTGGNIYRIDLETPSSSAVSARCVCRRTS